MDTTLLIFICIALGAVTILFVVCAQLAMKTGKNLDRMTVVVELIQRDVHELKASAKPVLEKAGLVLDQAQQTLGRLDDDLASLSSGVKDIAGIAQDVRAFEQSLLARVKPSLDDLASIVSGVARGVTTFARKLTAR